MQPRPQGFFLGTGLEEMSLDRFQVGLEKAWFTNFLKLSVDRPSSW